MAVRTPLRLPADLDAARRRSELHGVDPSITELPYIGQPTPAALALAGLSQPVLQRMVDQVSDAQIGVVLADRRGAITHRGAGVKSMLSNMEDHQIAAGFSLSESNVGTNGVGTSLEARSPAVVIGNAHHLDILKPFTCVNVPIIHPITHRVEGTVGLLCPRSETNPLLLPAAAQLAEQIQQLLLDGASPAERLLLERFLAAHRRADVAVMAINAEVLIASPAAKRLTSGIDQTTLWDRIIAQLDTEPASMANPVPTALETLAGDSLRLTCHPITTGGELTGAIVELEAAPRRRHRAKRSGSLAIPGMVGVTHQWRSIERDAADTAPGHEPLMITGEDGTGRMSAARGIAALAEAADVAILDSARVIIGGETAWLQEFDRAVQHSDIVIVKRIDALAEHVAAAVISMVGSALGGARLISTAGPAPGPVGGPHQRLLDHLGIVQIEIPPLRQRRDDIVPIARSLLALHGDRHLPSEFARLLEHQPWPGNVAELDRVLRSTIAKAGPHPLTPHHLPHTMRVPALGPTLHGLQQHEADAIVAALHHTDGNKRAAAELLGISRATFYRRLAEYGIR